MKYGIQMYSLRDIPPEDLMYYGLEYKFVTQFLLK